MNLSELFKTPFKLKGGGILNLKGFSKRVIDKEIGSSEDSVYLKLLAPYFGPVYEDIYTSNWQNIISSKLYLVCEDMQSIMSIDINNFINKIKAAADSEINIVDNIRANFQNSIFDRNSWDITVYDIQPDNSKSFFLPDIFSSISSGSEKAIIPNGDIDCILCMASIDNSSEVWYDSFKYSFFVFNSATAYRDGVLINAITDKYRGIFFMEGCYEQFDSEIIVPAFWIDGVSAANDESNIYKYIKFIGLKFEPILT